MKTITFITYKDGIHTCTGMGNNIPEAIHHILDKVDASYEILPKPKESWAKVIELTLNEFKNLPQVIVISAHTSHITRVYRYSADHRSYINTEDIGDHFRAVDLIQYTNQAEIAFIDNSKS